MPPQYSAPAEAAGARWYVVQTQPRAEFRALQNLERQGFRTFCPFTRRRVRHARTVKQVLSPLFPGYVFVGRDISVEPWRSVNGTYGVTRLVSRGDLPLPVPRGVIEVLKSRLDADGAMLWSSKLDIGQQVRITMGPFADMCGVLEHLDASGRVRVLLDLLGRSVSVALGQDAVVADV